MTVQTPLVLFSEVHGTVLDHGVPVPNAEIIQETVWSDNVKDNATIKTKSDANGGFHFDQVKHEPGLIRLVPHQPVILQRITIRYQDVSYMAWLHTKNTYENNSELDGRALDLLCDLARLPDFEGTHYGICKVR